MPKSINDRFAPEAVSRTRLSSSAHMLIRFVAEHCRPRAGQTTSMSSIATQHRFLGAVVQCKGQAALSGVMAEPDAIKELRGRDAHPGSAHFEEDHPGAGPRSELTVDSFGRHGATTEASTSGLAVTQLMQNGQWSSTAATAHDLHDDDEARPDAQMKRIKRRAKPASQATVK